MMTEPIDTVQSWQEWYKGNRVVAEMDEPGVTKNSRENLQDTKTVFNSLSEAECAKNTEKKTYEGFGDVICEGLCDLSGADVYVLFLKALEDNLSHAKKEYLKALELYQLATGKSTKENNG